MLWPLVCGIGHDRPRRGYHVGLLLCESAAEGKGSQPEGLHVRQDIRMGSWSCPAGTEVPAVPRFAGSGGK